MRRRSRTWRARRSTRRSGPGGRATSTGATDRFPLRARNAGRTPAPVRRTRRPRRRERAAGAGRRRHVPRRARRGRARSGARGLSGRRASTSSSSTATSMSDGRQSSWGPNPRSAGQRRTSRLDQALADGEPGTHLARPATRSRSSSATSTRRSSDAPIRGSIRAAMLENITGGTSTGRSWPRRTPAGRRRSSANRTSTGCGTPLHLDAAGRARPGRGLARPQRHPASAGRRAQRARVRRDPLPRPRHGSHRRARPGAHWRCATFETAAASRTFRTCRPRRSSRARTGGAPTAMFVPRTRSSRRGRR